MSIIVVIVVVVIIAAFVGAIAGLLVLGGTWLIVLVFGEADESQNSHTVGGPSSHVERMDLFFQEYLQHLDRSLEAVGRCQHLTAGQRTALVQLSADVSVARCCVVAVDRVIYQPGPKKSGELTRALIAREQARRKLHELVSFLNVLLTRFDPNLVQTERVKSIFDTFTRGLDEVIAILQGNREMDTSFFESTPTDDFEGEETDDIPSRDKMH